MMHTLPSAFVVTMQTPSLNRSSVLGMIKADTPWSAREQVIKILKANGVSCEEIDSRITGHFGQIKLAGNIELNISPLVIFEEWAGCVAAELDRTTVDVR